MSDEEHYDDDESEDESESEVLRNLRRQAREGNDAKKERDALARENAFLKAGIPSTKATDYFQRAYDGELTTEAIKAAAVEAGFLKDDDAGTEDDASAEEQEAARRVAAASSGSDDSTSAPDYEAKVAGAKSEEELLAVMDEYGSPTVNR